MTQNEFQENLFNSIEWPFELEEVIEVESNCGSVWINLQDGRSFFVMIGKCGDEGGENDG